MDIPLQKQILALQISSCSCDISLRLLRRLARDEGISARQSLARKMKKLPTSFSEGNNPHQHYLNPSKYHHYHYNYHYPPAIYPLYEALSSKISCNPLNCVQTLQLVRYSSCPHQLLLLRRAPRSTQRPSLVSPSETQQVRQHTPLQFVKTLTLIYVSRILILMSACAYRTERLRLLQTKKEVCSYFYCFCINGYAYNGIDELVLIRGGVQIGRFHQCCLTSDRKNITVHRQSHIWSGTQITLSLTSGIFWERGNIIAIDLKVLIRPCSIKSY